VGFPRFTRRTVTLADQFGTTTTEVIRPDRVCNPAGINGGGIADPTIHEMCYRISEPNFQRRDVLVSNAFGQQTLTVLSPEGLCNPAEKDGVPMTTGVDPIHFKCYKVRQSGSRFSEQTVTLNDQFETKVTRVIKPMLLCNPVDKNGEGMPDPGCHQVCYRIRDAVGQASFPGADVTIEDQFTTEDLRTFFGECRRAGFLCMPSSKTELP
jgi:hypothetical protein